jgi:aminopeptidase N
VRASTTRWAGLGLGLLALTATVTPATAATTPSGARDPYFPRQGNAGYDVAHYGLTLRYDPATRHLKARAAIAATATTRLRVFYLDFRRTLQVSRVTVDGHAATFTQRGTHGHDLVVTPAVPVGQGDRFRTVVRYAGRPQAVTDPDGSTDGWIETKDGAFVAGEPQGAPTWFPCNDTPRDKARYDFRVTVPTGITAIANGELVGRVTRHGGWHTFRWHSGRPMATYLATVTTGVFRVRTGTTPGGIPYYIATDPKVTAASGAVLDKVPAMTDYFVGLFGPYPFGSTGAVVDHAPKVGYALETQTKPLYDSPPDELTVSHELAHMWFGDSVTLTRWRDIWVNEGFAEFSAWMWSEHTGQKTAQAYFNLYYAKKADSWVFNPPPANPGGPADMFDGSVYERGAMTLQALRVKLGDGTFFPMLRAWYAAHTYGNVTVPEFTAFASSYAGRDLSGFFQTWLYDEGKPTTW